MNAREKENARRRRDGLKPLPPRWPWVLLILALLGGGSWWYYRTQILPTLPTAEIVAAPEPDPADSRMQINPFEYATVAPGTLQRLVRVTGTLKPSRQSQIASRSNGTVEEVAVRPGDRVEAGQMLVQVDVEALKLALDLQRSTAEATRVQLTLAEAQLERVQALYARGVASSSDRDNARSSVEGLRANLSALADQVASAELSLRHATVVAPFAGVVSERSIEPGQLVSTGTPLMTIVDLGTVELQAYAPLSAGPLIAPGQDVSVQVDGIAARLFTGTVARINPLASEGARTLPVYITIDNADGVLLGGMYSTGQIVVAEATEAISVPDEAVRSDRTGTYVLKIADGTLVRQDVEAGQIWAGDLRQILSGLEPGDVVITAALPQLVTGNAVTLVE